MTTDSVEIYFCCGQSILYILFPTVYSLRVSNAEAVTKTADSLQTKLSHAFSLMKLFADKFRFKWHCGFSFVYNRQQINIVLVNSWTVDDGNRPSVSATLTTKHEVSTKGYVWKSDQSGSFFHQVRAHRFFTRFGSKAYKPFVAWAPGIPSHLTYQKNNKEITECPHFSPFVRGIHRSKVHSHLKDVWYLVFNNTCIHSIYRQFFMAYHIQ